jgi:hopanoid biosynthesis associated RND transporter like protein HpnN
MSSLSTALMGVEAGQVSLAEVARPFEPLSATLDTVLAGRSAFLGWRTLVSGSPPSGREIRRFIAIQPKLDYGGLQPGAMATQAVRDAVRRLSLNPQNGVTVRLTGQIPMADEEFATLGEHMGLLGSLTALGMLVMLWFALHSARIIFAVVVTVLAGLASTAALGLLTIGRFNIISIAFIVLYIGLGIDFGIQFSVRYRAERHAVNNLDTALVRAGAHIGRALALAALAIAAGFYAFMPTTYVGVAELGAIAGTGMMLSFAFSLTLLPALLHLLNPRGEPENIGFRGLALLDRLTERRSGLVVTAGLALGLVSLALVPLLRFDANPLNLRSPKVESVATALDLMKDPDTTPNTINLLTRSREAAAMLSQRLSRLPEVAQVLSIDSFIPDDQPQKLAVIQDAATLLDPTLNPFLPMPPPTDAENVASLKDAAMALETAASKDPGDPAQQAHRLALVLQRLAAADAAARVRATNALIPGLNTLLEQTRNALMAETVSYETLPEDVKRDWISPSGEFRVQAFPKGDSNNADVLTRFTNAVRAVAPDATGTPIIIEESGRTIVNAFIEAGVLSFFTIAALLALILRSARDVALAVSPLVLAGALTLATCVVVGIPLNYANIIALPLLFGIGVAFDIYFVAAWRSGARGLLAVTARTAVILSAGTTASAFGTLSLSSHPGTASMGALLLISLGWILFAVLFFPTRAAAARRAEGGTAVSVVWPCCVIFPCIRLSASVLTFAASALPPPDCSVEEKSERRVATWLIAPFRNTSVAFHEPPAWCMR